MSASVLNVATATKIVCKYRDNTTWKVWKEYFVNTEIILRGKCRTNILFSSEEVLFTNFKFHFVVKKCFYKFQISFSVLFTNFKFHFLVKKCFYKFEISFSSEGVLLTNFKFHFLVKKCFYKFQISFSSEGVLLQISFSSEEVLLQISNFIF